MAKPGIVRDAYNLIIKEIIKHEIVSAPYLLEVVRNNISKIDLRDNELTDILENRVANNPNICVALDNQGVFFNYVWCGPNIEITEK